MNMDLALIVGAERFLAWVVLVVIGLLYHKLSSRLVGTDFYMPAIGITIESCSWALHQFNWWVHHVTKMHDPLLTLYWYNTHLVVAGVAYVGAAVGGAFVMQPLLAVRFGGRWWVFATIFMCVIWLIGYAIGLMWI